MDQVYRFNSKKHFYLDQSEKKKERKEKTKNVCLFLT